jgi:hypothetical protein
MVTTCTLIAGLGLTNRLYNAGGTKGDDEPMPLSRQLETAVSRLADAAWHVFQTVMVLRPNQSGPGM